MLLIFLLPPLQLTGISCLLGLPKLVSVKLEIREWQSVIQVDSSYQSLVERVGLDEYPRRSDDRIGHEGWMQIQCRLRMGL